MLISYSEILIIFLHKLEVICFRTFSKYKQKFKKCKSLIYNHMCNQHLVFLKISACTWFSSNSVEYYAQNRYEWTGDVGQWQHPCQAWVRTWVQSLPHARACTLTRTNTRTPTHTPTYTHLCARVHIHTRSRTHRHTRTLKLTHSYT
jgi:hypothetical protein